MLPSVTKHAMDVNLTRVWENRTACAQQAHPRAEHALALGMVRGFTKLAQAAAVEYHYGRSHTGTPPPVLIIVAL